MLALWICQREAVKCFINERLCLKKERKNHVLKVINVYGKNATIFNTVREKIHANFSLTPQTAKVMPRICDKYLVKMGKIFYYRI